MGTMYAVWHCYSITGSGCKMVTWLHEAALYTWGTHTREGQWNFHICAYTHPHTHSIQSEVMAVLCLCNRFQSERESGDRNFAIGYYLKEKKVWPPFGNVQWIVFQDLFRWDVQLIWWTSSAISVVQFKSGTRVLKSPHSRKYFSWGQVSTTLKKKTQNSFGGTSTIIDGNREINLFAFLSLPRETSSPSVPGKQAQHKNKLHKDKRTDVKITFSLFHFSNTFLFKRGSFWPAIYATRTFAFVRCAAFCLTTLFFSPPQCFPEGTDMTSVLDLYFQVGSRMLWHFFQFSFDHLAREFEC